jgi:hypothetical protein
MLLSLLPLHEGGDDNTLNDEYSIHNELFTSHTKTG